MKAALLRIASVVGLLALVSVAVFVAQPTGCARPLGGETASAGEMDGVRRVAFASAGFSVELPNRYLARPSNDSCTTSYGWRWADFTVTVGDEDGHVQICAEPYVTSCHSVAVDSPDDLVAAVLPPDIHELDTPHMHAEGIASLVRGAPGRTILDGAVFRGSIWQTPWRVTPEAPPYRWLTAIIDDRPIVIRAWDAWPESLDTILASLRFGD
jgi:hypothetical protein